jgi:hypothetical protein
MDRKEVAWNKLSTWINDYFEKYIKTDEKEGWTARLHTIPCEAFYYNCPYSSLKQGLLNIFRGSNKVCYYDYNDDENIIKEIKGDINEIKVKLENIMPLLLNPNNSLQFNYIDTLLSGKSDHMELLNDNNIIIYNNSNQLYTFRINWSPMDALAKTKYLRSDFLEIIEYFFNLQEQLNCEHLYIDIMPWSGLHSPEMDNITLIEI